ncbi:MFS transporter [Sinomonas humi]|uniref:Major facilitator transporter n=1 Tax=Sinomonas humi TaxID=1338436 RepID=A0A0B2ASI2_9MICC|nr:MFS transporter [Sinomonas humi]KHL04908.1 major facilitator transporter [Sinomonas humi]
MSTSAERTLASSIHDAKLKSAISKAARHLMPMLVILYFVAFLDRTNVGFAQAALKADRGVSDAAFALGAGIFFIGYAIFEVPSNLLLKRFGARFWLARISITWGIVAACFAFTTNDVMFNVLRFLLGVTEAGLFPGVIMFLSEWFPNKVRVQMFAIFYLAQPFSQMIGAPMSGGLISFGDSLGFARGWQVMFFGEGILAILAGIAALFLLTNSPAKAKFLDDDEKLALSNAMAVEDQARNQDGPKGIWSAMANWKVWYFTVIYFALQIAVYGTTFYLPQEVAGLLGKKVGWEVGLVSAIPWLVGLFACYFLGRAAHTVARRRNWGTLLYIGTGLFIVGSAWAGVSSQPLLGIVFITLAVASFLAVGPITWAYPTSFLTGAAAAAGIGLINSLGNLGGFVAPLMRTAFNSAMPTTSGAWGVISLGVFAFLGALMMYLTRFFRTAKSDELLDEPVMHH